MKKTKNVLNKLNKKRPSLICLINLTEDVNTMLDRNIFNEIFCDLQAQVSNIKKEKPVLKTFSKAA